MFEASFDRPEGMPERCDAGLLFDTLPRVVREVLRVTPGDELACLPTTLVPS
jgi:hypothetical protein